MASFHFFGEKSPLAKKEVVVLPTQEEKLDKYIQDLDNYEQRLIDLYGYGFGFEEHTPQVEAQASSESLPETVSTGTSYEALCSWSH